MISGCRPIGLLGVVVSMGLAGNGFAEVPPEAEIDEAGNVIIEGDIVIGSSAEEIPEGFSLTGFSIGSSLTGFSTGSSLTGFSTGSSLTGFSTGSSTSTDWPRGIIPFRIDPGANAATVQHIIDAIAHLNQNTGLRLIDFAEAARIGFSTADFIEFQQHATRCDSPIGVQGGQQNIRLMDPM